MTGKTIFYTNELTDEFAGDSIKAKHIDASWVYVHHSPWKAFTRFFWYRLIATPLAFLYTKIHWGHRIVNRQVFRQIPRSTGFFLYGNHTNNICDPLIPTIITFPRSVHVIVHPNNVSIPVVGKIMPSLGAIPQPDDRSATKNFLECIGIRIAQKKCITIYPEAHIWPFYTKIRPFETVSFRFPAQYNVPAVCFTNTYQKRRFRKTPRIVTYIDGPFYPDTTLSPREQREDLRNKCYDAMCRRAQNNTVEVIHYVKKEPDAPEDK